MAYAGSDGETRTQMTKVLHLGGTQQQVAAGFHAVMASMIQPATGAYQLRLANALWAQQGVRLRPEFASVIQTYYAGEFRTLDFAHKQQSVATINKWVAEKTANKIPGLLQAGDIDVTTSLVLTNAVYFKGDWSVPFPEVLTNPDSFTTGSGAKKQVPMMHQTSSFSYAERFGLQALELPYRGDQLSLLILLPVDKSHPWSAFTWAKFQQIRSEMHRSSVDVSLPKFKVDARLSLGESLSTMGMKDAFSQQDADFTGISKESWFISAALHEAVIEVNEKGTEAAAATALGMKVLSIPPQKVTPPVVFRADHPFVYAIVHKPTDAILFIGRLSDPTK